MAMNWDQSDQKAAMARGWRIAENAEHGLRIERYDDAQRFNCDAAAVAFVGMCAVLNYPLECKAFDYLAWHWAVEDAAREE